LDSSNLFFTWLARLLIVTIGGIMNVLWQWHSITAYGDNAIIERARMCALLDYECALAHVARGVSPINNIQDALDYIHDNEIGSVRDEVVPNEIVCEE
jgi:hypothetical protein